MNQKYIKFIFLIFVIKSVYSLNEDELFGDKSIIRKLRNDLGSFKSESKLVENNGKEHSVEERYNFKSKTGQLQESTLGDNFYAYCNEFEKYYSTNSKECYTIKDDKLIKLILLFWSPDATIKIAKKFKMLGPSHLLFFLIDSYDADKKNVKCENIDNNENIRCDLIFPDKAKIEYYFKDDNQLKMYPIKIKPFTKSDDKFIPYFETRYTKFDYSFNGDDYKVDFEYPIGVSCEIKDPNNPKIQTDLGEQFKIEYDAELEYLDLETKDKDVFLKTQLKSYKWFMDTNFSLSILDVIDKKTKENVRTYLDTYTNLAFDVYADKCIKYDLKDGYKQNWINTLYNIKYLPSFFFINRNFSISYLGKYKLNNEIYRVFERTEYNFFRYEKDSSNVRTPRYSVVTHYYSETDNKIPKLIEVRIRTLYGKLLGILKIKINKHNLASSSDTFNEKIDLDNCFKNLNPSTDYKELNVAFRGNLKSFNENYIKYEFRKLIERNPTKIYLPFSPLRIHDIKLEKKNNFINLTAKLLEPIDSLSYFKKEKDLTFDESKETSDGMYKIDAEIIKNIDNEELCSRMCIQSLRCSGFSYNKLNKNCKLRLVWVAYAGDIDNEYRYDWSSAKIKSEKGTILGKKMIKYYKREHLPVNYTLSKIDELIKNKDFNLILKIKDDDKGFKFNPYKKSNSNKNNLINYLLYSILAILVIACITFSIIKYQKRNTKNNSSKLELM